MTAVYPGSFDPLTFGHLDIIKRASLLCGGLCVLVLGNSLKRALFSLSERADLIASETRDIENLRICAYEGLLTDFLAQNNLHIVLRGLRSFADYEQEISYARAYRQLDARIETLFIPCDPKYAHISATMLRDAVNCGADARHLAPSGVINAITQKKGGYA